MRDQGPRKNERIRALKVRVIGIDGQQRGILDTSEAIRLAQQAGLDLVEVAPNANPPVCRIIEFGKYKYNQQKKSKSQKAVATKSKEIKLGINIADNDYRTKLRAAERFLYEGDKLKISMFLRRREIPLAPRGEELVQEMVQDLANVGAPDGSVNRNGPNISVSLSPLSKEKRVCVYNAGERT